MNAKQPVNQTDDDETLGLKIAVQDETSRIAFFMLYEKYQKLTNVFIQSRVPTKDADDLQQEVWFKAWKSAASFAGGNYRAWLMTIANNRIVDFYRKRARNREQDASEMDLEENDNTETPLENIIDQETKHVFSKCLEQLDEHAANIVRRRIAGDSYREICKAIDVSENAAHKILFNAKAQLRECVEAKSR